MRATVTDMRRGIAAAERSARGCGFTSSPLSHSSRRLPGARKRRWVLHLTTCGAALVLASCISTTRDGSGSARTPEARVGAGDSVRDETGTAAGAPAGAGIGGPFMVAASSTNWLPPEPDASTHGSAPVTEDQGMSETGSGKPLLDRLSQSSLRQTGSAGLRDRYDGPLLDVMKRHSWSIEVDGDLTDAEQRRERSPGSEVKELFSFTGKGPLAEDLNLAMKVAAVEHADYGGEEIAGFWLDRSDKWKKGTNSDFLVNLGVFDDRLQFTTRHSSSRYEDQDMAGEETGSAIMQRVEADVLRTDDFRMGFFGSHGRTDEDYAFLDDLLDDKNVEKTLKERNKQGEFADPGRERTKFGGTLGVGPLDLMLASVSETVFAGKNEGDEETGYEAKAVLDVKELRGSLGGGVNFWGIAPRWLYASYEIRDVDVAGSSADAKTTDASIGASWNWRGAYLNVDYWRFFLDRQQPGGADADWLGDGLDVSAGYHEPEWSIYAGYSRSRSNSFGAWSESEIGHSGWLSFSLKPEDWPDLKATVSTYLYDGDYIDAASRYEDWTLNAELDFSKYLVESPFYDTSMRLVVQFDQDRYDYAWSGPDISNDASDVFVGLRYDLSPKR